MKRQPFTLVVTTLNNAATLEACLASAAFADDILLLDSGSSDQSVAIAQGFGARIVVEAFKGYGPQKQSAIDQAHHDWILLLDADEALSAPAWSSTRHWCSSNTSSSNASSRAAGPASSPASAAPVVFLPCALQLHNVSYRNAALAAYDNSLYLTLFGEEMYEK